MQGWLYSSRNAHMSEAMIASRVVLSDGSSDPEAGPLHASSPIIIGFIAAVFGMALVVPGVARNWPIIVAGILIPAFFISTAIYAWSVINPGDITGLIVDRASRTIELVQSNAFATRRTSLAFEDVQRITLEQSYDHDGYGTHAAVLALSDGQRLPLAFALDQHRIEELRRLLSHVS
jgi:hypothetical protein